MRTNFEFANTAKPVRFYALLSKSGTAMYETALDGSEVMIPQLVNKVYHIARTREDFSGNFKFVNVTENDAINLLDF